jgi:hypothetical protein
MKKTSHYFTTLAILFAFIALSSSALLPRSKVHAQTSTTINVVATTAASYTLVAQNQATIAANAATAAQQDAAQGNASGAQAQTQIAANAAAAAQTAANNVTAIAQQNPTNTAVELSATQAETAATAAETSAAVAGHASGNQTVAQQDAAAANSESSAAQSSAAATQQSAVVAGASAQPTTSSGGDNFVSLSKFPAFANGGGLVGASTFATFFQSLYKICIGIAAALALLQIIRAGFTWMTAGDNTEHVSDARNLITQSVFGLLLVLSPVVVFTIINPSILNLSLNFGGIAVSTPGSNTGATGSGAPGATGASAGAQVGNDGAGIAAGQSCTTAGGGDGECAGNLICTNGTCQADPQLDNGSGAQGQPCQPSVSNCKSGLICDSTDTCNTASAATANAGSTVGGAGGGAASGGSVNPTGNTGS